MEARRLEICRSQQQTAAHPVLIESTAMARGISLLHQTLSLPVVCTARAGFSLVAAGGFDYKDNRGTRATLAITHDPPGRRRAFSASFVPTPEGTK